MGVSTNIVEGFGRLDGKEIEQLYTETITGYRAWKFGYTYSKDKADRITLHEPRLISTGISISDVSHTPWKPKEKNRAVHWNGNPVRDVNIPKDHTSPVKICNCGYWSFKEIEQLASSFPLAGPQVFGAVSIWGKIVEGSIGYRSEYAYPQKVYVHKNIVETFKSAENSRDVDVLAEIAKVYGVEVREYDGDTADKFVAQVS